MVEFYSKKDCPNCVIVKNLLNAEGVVYQTLFVDTNEDAFNKLKEKGFQSVPQIKKANGEWLDNCVSSVRKAWASGSLKKMLEEQ